MKVIDLLNKIANGEELPKKINDGLECFQLCHSDYLGKDYYKAKNGIEWLATINRNDRLLDKIEVIEVIEEPKKIEKLNLDTDERLKNVIITKQDYVIEEKINEIIDYINKGDSNE